MISSIATHERFRQRTKVGICQSSPAEQNLREILDMPGRPLSLIDTAVTSYVFEVKGQFMSYGRPSDAYARVSRVVFDMVRRNRPTGEIMNHVSAELELH